MARHSAVPPGSLPGDNLRAIGVAGLGCWILELNYAYAGFRVVREWSGGKRLFFCRDPPEEILIQAVCAENSSWSALRSSSLASQLNEKNKRRLPQLRATVF